MKTPLIAVAFCGVLAAAYAIAQTDPSTPSATRGTAKRSVGAGPEFPKSLSRDALRVALGRVRDRSSSETRHEHLQPFRDLAASPDDMARALVNFIRTEPALQPDDLKLLFRQLSRSGAVDAFYEMLSLFNEVDDLVDSLAPVHRADQVVEVLQASLITSARRAGESRPDEARAFLSSLVNDPSPKIRAAAEFELQMLDYKLVKKP